MIIKYLTFFKKCQAIFNERENSVIKSKCLTSRRKEEMPRVSTKPHIQLTLSDVLLLRKVPLRSR